MKLRVIVALAVLLSGAVHFRLWTEGMRDLSVIGPLFLLNAVAAVVIAVGVLLWRSWLPLIAAVGFAVATLVAFVISATVAVRRQRGLDRRVRRHRLCLRAGGAGRRLLGAVRRGVGRDGSRPRPPSRARRRRAEQPPRHVTRGF